MEILRKKKVILALVLVLLVVGVSYIFIVKANDSNKEKAAMADKNNESNVSKIEETQQSDKESDKTKLNDSVNEDNNSVKVYNSSYHKTNSVVKNFKKKNFTPMIGKKFGNGKTNTTSKVNNGTTTKPKPVDPSKPKPNSSNPSNPTDSSTPDDNQGDKIENGKLYLYSNKWKSLSMFLYKKAEKENVEAIQAKLLAQVPEDNRDDVFLGEVFSDKNLVLILSKKGLIDEKKQKVWTKDFPVSESGIFRADDDNILKVENNDRSSKDSGNTQTENTNNKRAKMRLFAGKVNANEAFTAKYLVGLPNNEVHVGVIAFADTSVIAGLNFNSQYTELAQASNNAAISLSKERLDLKIEGNTFTFNGEKTAMSKAIVGYQLNGKLNVANNIFAGENVDKVRNSNSYGMIHFMQRSELGCDLNIENNQFKNIKSCALNMMAQSKENINITNNVIDGTGDNGISLSIFSLDYPKKHNINIKGNVIKNYGRSAYEGYSQGGAGALAPSNDEEFGISMAYIDTTFGAFVNGKWSSTDAELFELLNKDNKIMSKEENDKNDNVVDSAEILVGQKGRFINTKERINKAKYGNKDHFFVVTKNENGTVTYGENSEEPTEIIEIGGLYIAGEGTGVVNLPSTLHIKGDLVVDLPNGSINNHAVVGGKIDIKAQSEIKNDAVFDSTVKEFTRKEAPNTVDIVITAIKNDSGRSVATELSKLDSVKVFVNGNPLADDSFTIDEASDTIHIKKQVADTWQQRASIVVKFKDEKNKVSEITSQAIVIKVLDKSSAKFEYSTKSFTHFNPEHNTITIKVKDVRDKFGNEVPANKTKIKANFNRYGVSVPDNMIKVNDDKDEIVLKAELLATIPASEYANVENQNIGTPVTYNLEIFDEDNNIGKISEDVQFKVKDSSYASFEFVKGLTFTQGEAPEDGIKLFVKDILDSNGNKVTKEKSVLKDNINIEPFPVNRDNTNDSEIIVVRDEQGNYVKEIFNPKYIKIDDDEDSITFTKEYLDKMKTQSDASTESGVKIFTFKYFDTTAKVDIRSNKVGLYIKKKEKERSNNTEIAFVENTLKIEGNKLLTDGYKLDKQTMVAEVLQHVIKANPRQQVLVYSKANMLKRNYQALEEGDKLKVIAEDAQTSVEYEIVLVENAKPILIKMVDEQVVKSYDQATMQVKQGTTADELIKAITPAEGVNISVVGDKGKNEYDVTLETTIASDKHLKATMGNTNYYWMLRPIGAKSKTRALLIGNNDYVGTKMDLVGPPNDLKMMEAVFKGNRVFGEKTDVSIHQNVLKKDLLKSIHSTFAGATDDDVSYFYYSGHGNNVNNISYLCTVDDKTLADGSFDPTAWVSVDELRAELDKIPGKKVIILDCCNSGGFIGKNFVDETTSATKMGVNGRLTSRDTSKEFVLDVKKSFSKKVEENAKANYLTGSEYKVLTASSANEYSYEDKKEGIGKFTKMLAMAAGLDNSNMQGDINKDKILSLNEAYDFLMKNVASTSHIQVFPYKDEFALFENVNVTPLSAETRVTSDVYNVNVRKDKFGKYYGSITDKLGAKIDGNQTAEQFIAKFEKMHSAQTIAVVKMQGSEIIALDKKDKLGTALLYLMVTAENGDVSRYSFSCEKVEAGANTKISSTNPAIELNDVIKAIKLTKGMTVKEFLGGIRKGDAGQKLAIYPKGANSVAKNDNEKITNLDYLLVTAANGKATQKYNITLMVAGDELKPDFAGVYIVSGNKIKSGTKKITRNITVGDLDRAMVNKNAIMRLIDPMGSGVFRAGDATSPFARPKGQTDKLSKGDVFKLKPMQWSKPPVVYIIDVESE
ncbi:MAG: caspase family protein [Eubacteriales bacterium]|nr:caspase family protein [Eubacteriales bacterium]MDY3333126.1 caspase family protein [Gallibacter sp.]